MTLRSRIKTMSLAGALLASCTSSSDGAPRVFVYEVAAAPAPSDGECLYQPGADEVHLSSGTVDVAFEGIGTYTPVFVVGNQNVTGAPLSPSAKEASLVIITGAITRITDAAGDDLITMLANMYAEGDRAAQATGRALESGELPEPTNPFSTAETTSIEHPGTSTPSYAIIPVTIIDGDTMAALRFYFNAALSEGSQQQAVHKQIELLTYTKVIGTTLGGDYVESSEFEFGVSIGVGELVSNLQNYGATGVCLSTLAAPYVVTTCVPGQDAPAPLATSILIASCSSEASDGGLAGYDGGPYAASDGGL